MLRFVVALEAEARPLVERFRLARDGGHRAFRVYRREDLALAVSGPGKAAAAAATAYLHLAAGGGRDAVWLNVGIAGHGSRAVGEAVLAHKVHDRAAGRSWYPPIVFAAPCATDQVTTVDVPERDFAAPGAFDMEAAGFWPTACRFASAELVHCLKIVSDGPRTELEKLDAGAVRRLVEARLETAAAVAEAAGALARELRALEADPPELATCLERWHFTVTERRELRRQLRRRQTLAPKLELPLAGVEPATRGKEINRRLRRWLDDLPPG